MYEGLRNEELHRLYDSPEVVKTMKARRLIWVGHVARMRGKTKNYTPLWLVNRRKRDTFGRPRYHWENNVKRDVRGV